MVNDTETLGPTEKERVKENVTIGYTAMDKVNYTIIFYEAKFWFAQGYLNKLK